MELSRPLRAEAFDARGPVRPTWLTDVKRVRPGVRSSGRVVLEFASYAAPCQIIAASFSNGRVVRVSEKVHPGWSRLYARVLKEGTLRVGDRVRMLQPSPTGANHGS